MLDPKINFGQHPPFHSSSAVRRRQGGFSQVEVPGGPGALREKGWPAPTILPVLNLQQLSRLCQDAQTIAAGTVLGWLLHLRRPLLGCGRESNHVWPGAVSLQERNDSVSFLPEAEAIFHGPLPYRPHPPWLTRPRHGNENFSCVEKSREPMGKTPKLGWALCTCSWGVLELDQYLKRKRLTVAASLSLSAIQSPCTNKKSALMNKSWSKWMNKQMN